MRSALVLIIGILILAFLAGTLALSSRLEHRRPIEESLVIRLRNEFVATHTPTTILNISDLGNRETLAAISDPTLLFPRSVKLPYAEISGLYRYALSCESHDRVAAKNPEVRKALVWHDFLCGKKTSLPAHFFKTPPLFHPSGSSYVRLAWKSERPEFRTDIWVRANIEYSHLLERANFPRSLLSPAEQIVSDLRPSALKAVLEEAGVAISPPSILFKVDGRESTGKYSVYPLIVFQNLIRNSRVLVSSTEDETRCLLKDGNSCWNADTERVARDARRPTLILSGLTLLLSLFAAAVLFRNLERQREQDRRKRFALSALTHELRTPVASLVLHSDLLRKDFDLLPPESQRSLMAVVDETQRLLRLTHATGQYLPAITGDKVTLEPATITSLKDFISEIVLEIAPGARFEATRDEIASIDPYWLAVALRNLLRNALKHGAEPIGVTFTSDGIRGEIRVNDSGGTSPTSLAEMIAPLRKSRESSGLGLGLYVVHEVMKEMGGRLTFSRSPTTFILEFPLGKLKA
jgi:signal transduction histidine kinase